MDAAPMVLTLADVLPAAAEIFVALAACVLLLVDALAGPRARGLVFVLAIVALGGSRLGHVVGRGGGAHGAARRAFRRRPDGHGAQALCVWRSGGDAALLARLPRAARDPEGRIPGPRAVRGARHPGHRVGREPALALPRHRDHVARALCDGRLRPRRRRRRRVGDEVLRAELDRVGRAPVRHIDRLRRDRQHPDRRRGRGGRQRPGADRPPVRARVHRPRRRLQVRRRAVPHVDPRRLPRGADAGDAVHRRRPEDRLVRARDPRCSRTGSAASRRPGRTCSSCWRPCR